MSGTGSVSDVGPSFLPRETTKAQRVRVDPAGGGKPIMFFIPVGPAPTIGTVISWGPHYAWWGDPEIRVHKLTWELDPDDPTLYTG